MVAAALGAGEQHEPTLQRLQLLCAVSVLPGGHQVFGERTHDQDRWHDCPVSGSGDSICRVDTASAAIIILGSSAILMAIATWLGWMRHQGRTDELPAPLRGTGAIVVMIAVFIVVMVAVLITGSVSN